MRHNRNQDEMRLQDLREKSMELSSKLIVNSFSRPNAEFSHSNLRQLKILHTLMAIYDRDIQLSVSANAVSQDQRQCTGLNPRYT